MATPFAEALLAVPHCPVLDYKGLHADATTEITTILTCESCFVVKRKSPLLWVQMQAVARHIAAGSPTELHVLDMHGRLIEDMLCCHHAVLPRLGTAISSSLPLPPIVSQWSTTLKVRQQVGDCLCLPRPQVTSVKVA